MLPNCCCCIEFGCHSGGPRLCPHHAKLLSQSSFGQVRSTVGPLTQHASLLIRREDNRCMCGPQRSWGRPEECGANQGTLDDGCGTLRQPQCQWSRCHSAQGSWIERAGQEPCRQGLGQLLVQGQFSLKQKSRVIFKV